MPEFIVTDPSGKEHIVNAPEGATQEQALEFAKSSFGSTQGGAALGNPNIQRQGERSLRSAPDTVLETGAKIGGAGLMGGIAGAFAPELLMGAGGLAAAIPGGQPLAPWLIGAGQTLRGARAASAAAGVLSGLGSETVGQIADVTQVGKEHPILVGEGARLLAGGFTPETARFAKQVLEKYAVTPAMNIWAKYKHEAVKSILEKFQTNPGSLSEQERRFIEGEISALRGGPKTDVPLQAVGDSMEEAGARGIVQGARATTAAEQQAAGIGKVAPIPERQLADIGGNLRSAIVARNEGYAGARQTTYKANEAARDAIVSAREGKGSYVNDLPEYQKIIQSLQSQLDNSEAMKRSPDVQRSIQKVLNELQSSEIIPGEKKLVQSGLNLDLQELPGKPKPTSFQAIDDVRRKLGEVFKGKPAEGYEALNDARGKELYAQLSDLQKKFAGGENGPQAKLLHEYALGSEALAPFRSKMGRKATALDLYDESKFATDPSSLPSAYFKTRASVQQLKELTGNSGLVNKAALEYVNNELKDSTAAEARAWAGKNAEWLKELPIAQRLVDQYAGKLEVSERATKQAAAFAAEAASTNTALTKSFPKERIVNLVQNGTAEQWAKAGPAIASVPEGKANVLSAVRQTIADSPLRPDDFARRIRPALEQSRLADKASLDMIETRLKNIAEKNIPEPERLAATKRIILQALAGYSAGGMARGAVEAAKWVPE